ncbi:hypothetical protein E2C01_028372 [Portunus trituberculatus]|uniref:Uncharacterized protein n=1 Tax=Portunus trituberculatus TaxID=210409 RepID=A0A5B7ENV1_PORTR|nr:hypothetical protein [Portunus trituberculatus]
MSTLLPAASRISGDAFDPTVVFRPEMLSLGLGSIDAYVFFFGSSTVLSRYAYYSMAHPQLHTPLFRLRDAQQEHTT